MFTNLNLSDMETSYNIFRSVVLNQIKIEENHFGVNPELTATISKLGCRIFELLIAYFSRTYE